MADKPSLTELMNMAKKMQDNMRQVQELLENKEFEGIAGTGAVTVKVIMNGKKKVLKTIISEQAHKGNKEVLEDLCTAAFNNASDRVDGFAETELKKLTKDLGLPPDFPVGE